MLVENFGQTAKSLPNAAFIPLCLVPAKAFAWLSAEGHLPRGRTLQGLPNPSGANAERIAYFLGKRPNVELSAKTAPAKLDAVRASLRAAVAAL